MDLYAPDFPKKITSIRGPLSTFYTLVLVRSKHQILEAFLEEKKERKKRRKKCIMKTYLGHNKKMKPSQ